METYRSRLMNKLNLCSQLCCSQDGKRSSCSVCIIFHTLKLQTSILSIPTIIPWNLEGQTRTRGLSSWMPGQSPGQMQARNRVSIDLPLPGE
ncbi:MAG: hypothetical protein KDA78_12680 [Planctomycetaceae bacterium]|nr:hypothetical protein [Planctomycetaceae bacterium]